MARPPAADVYLLTADVGAQLVAAVEHANTRTSRQVVALAEVFGRGLAPGERQAMFQAIGEGARRSVQASYGATVTRRKKAAGRYPYQRVHPRNRRYAGGKIKEAIRQPNFFRATPDGLDFINVTELNRRARHWARLNAGAGSVGRGSRRRFEVRFSNLVVASLGLEMDPRPAFTMPRGFWFNREEGQRVAAGANPRGTDEFYPMSEVPFGGGKPRANNRLGDKPRGRNPRTGRGTPTRGIEARNFLDAGVARIARELPIQYENLYGRLWERAVIAGAHKGAPVSGPRPRGGQQRVPSQVVTFRRY